MHYCHRHFSFQAMRPELLSLCPPFASHGVMRRTPPFDGDVMILQQTHPAVVREGVTFIHGMII
jgi:hypothetical protein